VMRLREVDRWGRQRAQWQAFSRAVNALLGL